MTFAPFGNGTHLGWRAEPGVRGTSAILITCMTTLSLCVWSALHLNLPERNPGLKQSFRKLGWVLVGMFAPELIAVTAYCQLEEARSLSKAMAKRFSIVASPSQKPKKPRSAKSRKRSCLGLKYHSTPAVPEALRFITKSTTIEVADIEKHQQPNQPLIWSMVHSRYAAMGGFVVEVESNTGDVDEGFFPLHEPYLTLTPSGVALLATLEPHLIPNISVEDIKDKSKANWLSKTVVLGQATWFCIQSLVRVAQGLSISLLELNTMVHVVCAFLVYALWWDKPLDVGQPTKIRVKNGDMARELIALMALDIPRRQFSDDKNSELYELGLQHSRPCAAHKRYWRIWCIPQWSAYPLDLGTLKLEYVLPANPTPPTSAKPDDISNDEKSKPGEDSSNVPGRIEVGGDPVYGFGLLDKDRKELYYNIAEDVDLKCAYVLAQEDVLRFQMADAALRRYDKEILKEYFKVRDEKLRLPSKSHRVKLVKRRNNFGYHGLFYGLSGRKPGMIAVCLMFAGIFYGGSHLLAWNAAFPTETWRFLWRFSSIFIAGFGPGFLLVSLLFAGWLWTWLSILEVVNEKFPNFRKIAVVRWIEARKELLKALYYFSVGVSIMIWVPLIYIFSRVSLTVICFINLRYLPDSAFVTPSFSLHVPHIS